jgi:hypothetical protein
MTNEIITRDIVISTEYGELVDVPAEINLHDEGAEIISVNITGLKLCRDQIVAMLSNAEVVRIEGWLFEVAVEDGLVEGFDRHEEQRKEFMAGTGYPFGMHC